MHFSCCTLLLLHTWITFTDNNHSNLQQQQQQPPSLLCTVYLYLLCTLCMQCSQFLCMLTPRRYPPPLECSIWSSSWLFSFSVGSPRMSIITVCYPEIRQPLWQFETLRLLCDNRTHFLCFNYRPQFPSICQSLLRIVFLHLDKAWRLFISSSDHTVVSSNSLADVINGFWQFHCIVHQ